MNLINLMQPLWNKRDLPVRSIFSTGSNRRWAARQKIHTPAYVSVDACEDGTIFGLNEVFDIGTNGLSFQNPQPLTPGSRVRLNLELSGTDVPVRATGRVMWSDLSGRTGVQIKKSSLSDSRRLDEYLFLNAITACSHYQALQTGANSSAPAESLTPQDSNDEASRPESFDYVAVLTALAEVQAEVQAKTDSANPDSANPDSAKPDLNSSLQIIAEQAVSVLHASGVAIAISEDSRTDSEIVCRASAGSAPGVGTHFQRGIGFSGECIISGALMYCDDTETDPRVDRNASRDFGIRSIIAAPIRTESSVAGLIEVFSAQPRAFSHNSRIFLQGLSNLIVLSRPASQIASPSDGSSVAPQVPSTANSIAPTPSGAPSDEFFASRLRRLLLLGTSAALLVVATLLMPWMRINAGKPHPPATALPIASFHPVGLRTSQTSASELKRLRRLAESGDSSAQFALGARYATGDEVTQDYSTAARWFSRAANQGHIVAQATMGAYYWAGRGVPEDLHQAYFWSVLAQAGGDQGSKFRLASLASLMDHAEVVQIQEEADQWIHRHQVSDRASADPNP